MTGWKTIVLVRHTDNEGDVLTPQGVADAVAIGRSLDGPFDVAASSGAQRATQTVGCLLGGFGRVVPGGVVVIEALRSTVEDRWRAACREAGAGDLASLRSTDPPPEVLGPVDPGAPRFSGLTTRLGVDDR